LFLNYSIKNQIIIILFYILYTYFPGSLLFYRKFIYRHVTFIFLNFKMLEIYSKTIGPTPVSYMQYLTCSGLTNTEIWAAFLSEFAATRSARLKLHCIVVYRLTKSHCVRYVWWQIIYTTPNFTRKHVARLVLRSQEKN